MSNQSPSFPSDDDLLRMWDARLDTAQMASLFPMAAEGTIATRLRMALEQRRRIRARHADAMAPREPHDE